MRGKSKSRFSSRPSKRKNETEPSSAAEPKSKRISKKKESEQKFDQYCWLCHMEANDNICVTCHRAYHNSCLDKSSLSFSELGVCPECQSKSVDGTELNSNRFFNLDKLKKMLDILTRRSFDKKRERNEIFLCWPEEDRDNLYKIIDFEILLDNINHVLPYTRTAEFYGDVKYIYHNAYIAYGANSDQVKAAENLRRDVKTELLDLEACPECYYYMYCYEDDNQNPFVRLCDCPHDIVWAQLTGHPYWPAKSLKVVKGMAHVRFFGEHEQSDIPISKCLFLSESHPKDKNSKLSSLSNSGPKSQRYKSAKTELLEYIRRYRRKYGDFPYYPHKTLYKPHEKQNEVVILSTEGSCNRKTVQMKLEGNVNEDSDMFIMNTTSVVHAEDDLTFENSVTHDIPAPIGSGTEGQYPTLAQINPSIDPSSSPCEGSETGGQYPTYPQLSHSIDPRMSPSQDNLNKNSSAVTSINMTFSLDENTFNIENANPVVTSVDSLPPTDTVSIVLPSPAANVPLLEKSIQRYKGIFHQSGPKGQEGPYELFQKGPETVHSMIVTNNASNDSPVNPDSLCNMANNFPIYEGNENEVDEVPINGVNENEVDDEVHYIGQRRGEEEHVDFNPDLVLPMLFENHPELKTVIERTRYISDACIVQLYASLYSNSNNVGKMSKLCVDLRKSKSRLKEALEGLEKLREVEADCKELRSSNQLLEFRLNQAISNARSIINGLKISCAKKVEETLKAQFLANLNEKDDCILKKDKQLQVLKREVRSLKNENEMHVAERQRLEEELKATKYQISPDTISEYKRTHYCNVCEKSAAFVCCLNTSYCSSECQERYAEQHRKHCKSKITCQSVLQQRFISKQSVTTSHSVITSGRAIVNNPSNSDLSESDATTGSTEHKKSQIHRASASPLLPTPHYRGTASSSRSYSSKTKRRR